MTTILGRESLPFYCRQIGDQFCGPASALIVLEFLGITTTSQEEIANVSSTQTPAAWNSYGSWVSRPDEVALMLQKNISPAPSPAIAPIQVPDRDPFRQKLLDVIKDPALTPPIVPVHDWHHWVVLFQYQDQESGSGVKDSYYGYDPIYLSPTENVDPNLPTIINLANKPSNFKSFLNRVLITAALPPAPGIKAAPHFETTASERQAITTPLPTPLPAPRLPGSLGLGRIAALALQELKAYGLLCLNNRDPLAPRTPSTPLLVKRLDQPGSDYYLVGLQNWSKKQRLLARLDALEGQYLDSLLIPPTDYLFGQASVGSVPYKRAQEKLVSGMKKADWFQAFDAELARKNQQGENAPTLVWTPCNESPSAFYPFYQVKTPTGMFFVRIDGVVFSKLTGGPPLT